jgi:oligogalacturonide lyase
MLQPCTIAGEVDVPSTFPVFRPERSVYTDPETGWPVVRLTRSSAEDIKIYQTHPSWTADGKWIVFHSTRKGMPQLFAVHEELGPIVQMTDGPGVQGGQVCLSRRRPELLTVIQGEIVLLDCGALLSDPPPSPGLELPLPRRKMITALPSGSELSGTMSWNASETKLYVGLRHLDQSGPGSWSIAQFNLDRRDWKTIVELDLRVGHVQANPWSDEWLMYCHETGGDSPQRMWLLRVDGSVNRPFYRESFDEWVTHELWWDAGSALFTVWPKDETMTTKPHGLVSVDLDNLVRFHSRFPYWHVTGAENSPYLVADTFEGQILRVHTLTGERVVLTRGHRLERKGAHPHPTLDPTGRKVLFNSNAESQADLYLVALEGPVTEAEHSYRNRRYSRRGAQAALVWQRELRADLASLLKVDDLWARSIPLEPRILQEKVDGSRIQRDVEIRSSPERQITVRVTLPRDAPTPVPAVVCLHGHGGNRSSVYHPAGIYKGFARTLTERGYVTIAADIGQHDVFEPGRTLLGERLWDLKRCVDYLEQMPTVDASRIGCAGLSLGGEMAMWLAALDTRIQATVSSGFLTTMDQMEQNHCLCWKLPGLRQLVDYADLYSLIAPRPLQCQNGRWESPADFWVPLARSAMADIRMAYTDLGRSDQAQLLVHDGGHEIALPSLLKFFERHLQ